MKEDRNVIKKSFTEISKMSREINKRAKTYEKEVNKVEKIFNFKTCDCNTIYTEISDYRILNDKS